MEAGTIVALPIEEFVYFWLLFADFRLKTELVALYFMRNKKMNAICGASVRAFPFSWPRKIQEPSLNVMVTIFIPYMLIHCL